MKIMNKKRAFKGSFYLYFINSNLFKSLSHLSKDQDKLNNSSLFLVFFILVFNLFLFSTISFLIF